MHFDDDQSSAAVDLRTGHLGRRAILRLLAAAGAAAAAPPLRRAAAQGATPPAAATPALGLQPDGSRVWRVQVGAADMATMAEAMAFLPGEITINAGDKIFFDFGNPPRFHTVSFLAGQEPPPFALPEAAAGTPAASPAAGPPRLVINPAVAFPMGETAYDGAAPVSSGVPLDATAAPFVVAFPKAGAFDYRCLVHPTVMKGKVVVQAQGSALPHEQADDDQRAADEWATILADAKAAVAERGQPAASPQAGGATVWDVSVGAGKGQAEVMAFVPDKLTIKRGDTVRWTYHALVDPHTVTFSSGDAPPDLILVEPQAGGPPKLVLNPQATYPAGGPTYDGTGYVNSGFMGQAFRGPTTFQLTFAAAGDFVYYCAIHGSPTQGMRAKITVA